MNSRTIKRERAVVKNVRTWQGISELAKSLGSYPKQVRAVQDEYDLFDTRPVSEDDNLSPRQRRLTEMWRLKAAATIEDFEDATQEISTPRATPPTPAQKPPREATPNAVDITFRRQGAAVVTVTRHIAPAPFNVSSPADLVAALYALAVASDPNVSAMTITIDGKTHKAAR